LGLFLTHSEKFHVSLWHAFFICILYMQTW
jgi:hypothetical protein